MIRYSCSFKIQSACASAVQAKESYPQSASIQNLKSKMRNFRFEILSCFTQCRRIRQQSRRSGVILVLVLLTLTLCATIAAQVTSRTIRLTGQAADSQRELQSRWAIVSIRRSILNDAPALLMWHGGPHRDSADIATKPIPHRQDTLTLGGNRYLLVLQDESAKAPIARMLQNKNQQELKPILRQLAQGKAILQSKIPSNPTQWLQVLDLVNSRTSTIPSQVCLLQRNA